MINVRVNFPHDLLTKKDAISDNSNIEINLLDNKKIKKDFVSSSKIFFNKTDIAAYEISDGSVINIYPYEDINTNTLLYYGLQIPFGCACAQNKKLVFHASVAEKDGKCFAFLGSPGAGKSSLLIELIESGWNFITEDICVLDNDYNLNFTSSFPYIKLSNEVATMHTNKLILTDIKADRLGRQTYQVDLSNVSAGGVLESDLDEQQALRPVSKHDVYADLEQDLTVAEQVKAEADKRYAEHAQQRWEEAERNDPDLIEAGVTRLGDLVTTDYFEKNQDSKAVSKLTSDQSSSDEK